MNKYAIACCLAFFSLNAMEQAEQNDSNNNNNNTSACVSSCQTLDEARYLEVLAEDTIERNLNENISWKIFYLHLCLSCGKKLMNYQSDLDFLEEHLLDMRPGDRERYNVLYELAELSSNQAVQKVLNYIEPLSESQAEHKVAPRSYRTDNYYLELDHIARLQGVQEVLEQIKLLQESQKKSKLAQPALERNKDNPRVNALVERFKKEENALMTGQYSPELLESYMWQGGYTIPDHLPECNEERFMNHDDCARYYLKKSGNWLDHEEQNFLRKIQAKIIKLDGLPNDIARETAYRAILDEEYARIRGSSVKSLDNKRLQKVHAQACHDVLMLELRAKVSDVEKLVRPRKHEYPFKVYLAEKAERLKMCESGSIRKEHE